MQPKADNQKEDVKETILGHVERVTQALETGQPLDIAEAIIKLGMFLQAQYPNTNLECFQSELRALGLPTDERKLPNISSIAAISEARVLLFSDLVNKSEVFDQELDAGEKELGRKTDAVAKGVALLSSVFTTAFKEVLGEEAPAVQQDHVDRAKEAITKASISIIPADIIFEINVITKYTLSKLEQQLAQDPSNQQAKSSCAALESLQKIIQSPDLDARAKLQSIRAELSKDSVKKALNSNSDPLITRFLKVMDHLFKTIITLSIAHWSKEPPLKSVQQQALRMMKDELKKEEPEGSTPPSLRGS